MYFQYKDGEEVVLWVNTVGPYHNRQETYAYFSLPFCQGPKQYISHYHETLGEALQGTELEFSGLDIQFKSKHNIEPVSPFIRLTHSHASHPIQSLERPLVYEQNYQISKSVLSFQRPFPRRSTAR